MNQESWSTSESVTARLFFLRQTPHRYRISRRDFLVLGSVMFCSRSISSLKCIFRGFFFYFFSLLRLGCSASWPLSLSDYSREALSVLLSLISKSQPNKLSELLVFLRTKASSYLEFPTFFSWFSFCLFLYLLLSLASICWVGLLVYLMGGLISWSLLRYRNSWPGLYSDWEPMLRQAMLGSPYFCLKSQKFFRRSILSKGVSRLLQSSISLNLKVICFYSASWLQDLLPSICEKDLFLASCSWFLVLALGRVQGSSLTKRGSSSILRMKEFIFLPWLSSRAGRVTWQQRWMCLVLASDFFRMSSSSMRFFLTMKALYIPVKIIIIYPHRFKLSFSKQSSILRSDQYEEQPHDNQSHAQQLPGFGYLPANDILGRKGEHSGEGVSQQVRVLLLVGTQQAGVQQRPQLVDPECHDEQLRSGD